MRLIPGVTGDRDIAHGHTEAVEILGSASEPRQENLVFLSFSQVRVKMEKLRLKGGGPVRLPKCPQSHSMLVWPMPALAALRPPSK